MQASSRAFALLPSLGRPASAAASSLTAGPKVTFHTSSPTYEHSHRTVCKPARLLPLTASPDPVMPFDKVAPALADRAAATALFDDGVKKLVRNHRLFPYW